MKFEQSATFKNLCSSFASECQEGAKYQFLAKEAEKKQLLQLKMTFKTLAKEEMAHAERMFNLINTLGGSIISEKTKSALLDNVLITAGYGYKNGNLLEFMKSTEKTEIHQRDVVYKNFASIAKKEGFDEVAAMFEMTATVEGDHAMLLNELSMQLKNGNMYKNTTKTKWKCSECGHEVEGKVAPNECPLCKYPQGGYIMKSTLYQYYMR